MNKICMNNLEYAHKYPGTSLAIMIKCVGARNILVTFMKEHSQPKVRVTGKF